MKRWLALLGLLIGFSLAQPITFQFWTISLKPRFDAYIDGLIQAYEKAHPGITIQWSDFPIGTIQDKLLAAIAAGQSPDVVNLNGEFALPLAAKGGLVNLGKVLGAASLKAYFPGLWPRGPWEVRSMSCPGTSARMSSSTIKPSSRRPGSPALREPGPRSFRMPGSSRRKPVRVGSPLFPCRAIGCRRTAFR